MTTAYPADFVAQHEIITKSWRTDKCPDAKQLRDKTAGELRKEGWTIEFLLRTWANSVSMDSRDTENAPAKYWETNRASLARKGGGI